MTNKEKFEKAMQVTVQDVIDWLDGCAVAYIYTDKQMDCISNQYCSKKIHSTIFSKDKYERVNLSNGWYLSNEKPILSEFEAKKYPYWKSISKNRISKCSDTDEIVQAIVETLSPYLHFKINGRSYDYINIKKIIAKDGRSVYVHDRSEEIKALRSKIWDLELLKTHLEAKLKKIEHYQSIHKDLQGNVSDQFYTEGKHYL